MGKGWLCPVSAAIKNASQEFKNYFCFNLWKAWKVKLESAHFYKVQSDKITV